MLVYFGLMAVVHVVLTVLVNLGVWDTGVGYFLDYELPAWLIALLDGSAAFLLWAGYRRGAVSPWLGLTLTVIASAIMIGRALWFVIIPVLVVFVISGSIRRVMQSRRAAPPAPDDTRVVGSGMMSSSRQHTRTRGDSLGGDPVIDPAHRYNQPNWQQT